MVDCALSERYTALPSADMITGYNTDVRRGEVVFHVQTEDKGLHNPCIESLVYVGGQILARKRSGYRSLLAEGGGEEAIAELMERQHRLTIDEIRGGELDERLEELRGGRRAAKREPRLEDEGEPVEEAPPAEAPEAAAEVGPDGEAEGAEMEGPAGGETVERPAAEAPPPAAARDGAEPEAPPSEEARTLDQVILDYLEAEAEPERLVLSMETAAGEMRPGSEVVLLFHASSSADGNAVEGARVTVRMISTREEPRMLGSGLTDDVGELELRVSIPGLDGGSAAILVSAESDLGGAEVKQLI